MIRILHIVHAVTRGGGLTNMVVNYYRTIERTKVQFDFLYFRESESDFKAEIESYGGRCFKMTEPNVSFAFLKERDGFFKAHLGEFCAIHCHVLFAAAVFANPAKRFGIKNIISHSHNVGYGVGNPLKIARNRFLVYQAKHKANYYCACSKNAAVFMFGKKLFYNKKVIIFENAFDLKRFYFNQDYRDKYRLGLDIHNKYVIGNVGTFTFQKNHLFLIDIFYELQKNLPDSVLLLIGGDGIAAGSTKTDVMAKVERLGLNNKVRFLGLRDDVDKLLSAMDAFVFPSLFEGLGIALVEAQAAGLPCVVSGAVPEEAKVSGDYTVINGFDDPVRWAGALAGYADRDISKRSELDPELYQFDIDKQSVKLENFYLSLK